MALVEFGPKEKKETHERSVEIRLDGALRCVLQASPYDLKELAVGVLYGDGALSSVGDIERIDFDGDTFSVNVLLASGTRDDGLTQTRAPSAVPRGSSGGFLPVDSDARTQKPSAIVFDPDDLLFQMERLCRDSAHRNAGECVHGCAVGSAASDGLELVFEDIGRHNAMDKVIGRALLDGVDLSCRALFITGRISAEMVLKARRAGCPLLVSRKSATDDAIARGERFGITLVSHCRDGSMRVLTHPARIKA